MIDPVAPAEFLFSNRKLVGRAASRQDVPGGDPLAVNGLRLVAYYSLPAGSDADGDGIPSITPFRWC